MFNPLKSANDMGSLQARMYAWRVGLTGLRLSLSSENLARIYADDPLYIPVVDRVLKIIEGIAR